jgi:hypothetical protein
MKRAAKVTDELKPEYDFVLCLEVYGVSMPLVIGKG